LTDVNSVVLSRCRENLSLPCNASSRHQNVHLRQLDWFSAMDTDGIPSTRGLIAEANPDIIFGADIVYDPSIIPPLIATIHLAISAVGSTGRPPVFAVLALTVRNPETFRCFLNSAEEAFTVIILDTTVAEIEDGRGDERSIQEVVIIQLGAKDQ